MKPDIIINKKGVTIIMVCLLLLIAGKITHAQSFTLKQILDSIDINNPGLQQFALKTNSSNALGEASKAWAAPNASFGMSEFPYGSISKTNNNMMSRKMLMLRLEQMLPNFSKQKAERKYYQALSYQNEDDRATMENLLFAEAKQAYYDIYIAREKMAILQQQQKKLKLLIQIAEGRLEYNKASLPNIYKARANLSDLKSSHIKLQSKMKQSVTILNMLMNRPLNFPLDIDTSWESMQNFNFNGATANAAVNIQGIDSAYIENNRSDVSHTTHVIHSMMLSQEITKQSAKPTFGISWENMRMAGNMYDYSLMATMSIPIAPWFSKGYKSKVKALDFQIQALQKKKRSQVIEALGDIQKDWLHLQSAQKDLQIFKNEVIPAYAKTYQAYLNAFSENTGDIYETLSAWNDLTMKRMEYYDKLSKLFSIRTRLETEMQKEIENKYQ